ncbi:MAG: site-specific integrase [Thermococcus sp.]|nr:site-specific integrase [Thermococcus sp.]
MEEDIEMPQSAFPAIGHVFHSSGKQEYYRRLLQVQNPNQYYVITEEDIDRLFLEFEAKGVSHAHKRSIEYLINMFLKEAAKEQQGKYIFTMRDLKEYLATIRREYSVSYYRKNVTYLKKLFRIAGIDLAESLKAPQEIDIDLTIVTVDDIKNLVQLVDSLHLSWRFEDWKKDQFITAMLLMAVTGMRVSELARVPLKDIDLENRRIYLNTSQTKTKQSRVVFFTEEIQELLQEYIQTYKLKLQEPLATVPQMQRPFRRKSPLRGQKLRPKHMRKFFAQEWDRRNGNATIKKLLMGHSIRYDINALHYSHHTVDELQDAYEKVFGNLRFLK